MITGLDLLLLAFLGVGMVRGWFTGAVRQLVGVLGWMAGFILAAALMGPVGSTVVTAIGFSERTAPVIGFVVVFVAALAGVSFLGHAVRKTLEAVKLGGVDRLAGSVFGAFKAALGLSVFLTVTAFSPIPGGDPWLISAQTREESLVHDALRGVAPATWSVVRGALPGVQRVLSDKFNAWDAEGAE
jgi:membrane protein required for colicin V production